MAKNNQPKNPNPKLSKAAQQRRKDIDNAKRRYKRQAERYRKEASNLEGRDGDLLRIAADQLDARRESLNGINVRKTLDSDTKALINDSKNYLVSNNRREWQRGETLGKSLLSGSTLGHRFFAITEKIWQGIPSTGLGDDRRLNAIRRALSTPDNPNPNALEMIRIVEDLASMDLSQTLDVGEGGEVCSDFACSTFAGLMTAQLEFTRTYG